LRICAPYYLELPLKDRYIYGKDIPRVSVKTQFAGEQVHKIIIHLLEYLSKKYFSDFTVYDEGKYWETKDEKILHKNFEEYNALLKSVSDAIQTQPIKEGETFEKYFERILKQIHSNRKR
jgi:hypothetical protein